MWHEVYGDRRQEIVFIGQDLEEARVRKDLDACLLEETLALRGPSLGNFAESF